MHWVLRKAQKRFWLGLGISGLAAICGSGSSGAATAQETDFARDVLPILSNSCFACHGPDGSERQAGLRLDVREQALSAGVFVPGAAEDSPLISRIESADPDLHMPPPGTRKDLSETQRKILRQWIDDGAKYSQHWAWQPPTRPAEPPAGNGWALNPIDRFVAAKLDSQGLQAAPRADTGTLYRRLALDLVGIPPGSGDWTNHGSLSTESGYRDAVERLLASPHYGERMASAWLDVVRYADTVGYHGDQNQNVFPYRDWVVQAFNDNMPFDQFVRWQLAGDLIDHPSEQSLTATAFNRLNMVTREGGAQPDEYLAKYAADRVRTVGAAFLGVTLGCAECHDHKFDPVTTRDFYSLAACFSDIQQWGVYQDYGYTPNPDLRGWSNDHPFPPELEVAVPALAARRNRLIEERNQRAVHLLLSAWKDPQQNPLLLEWLAGMQDLSASLKQGWQTALLSETTSAESAPVPAGSASDATAPAEALSTRTPVDEDFLVPDRPETGNLKLRMDRTADRISALKLEFPGDPDSPGRIFDDPAAGTTLHLKLSRHFPESSGQKPEALKFHAAGSTHRVPEYSNGFEREGILGGWGLRGSFPPGTAGIWLLDQPLVLQDGEFLVLELTGNRSRRFRVATSPLVPTDLPRSSLPEIEWSSIPAQLAKAETSPDSPAGIPDLEEVALQWVLTADSDGKSLLELRALDREIRRCRDGRWPVLVTRAIAEPRTTRILPRGNWQDLSGEVVLPATPAFLTARVSADPGRRPTRLDLANWLVQNDNPLTARVQMNRLWKHFFGTGLSPVLDDLGAQGQYPSHPELLDWMAVEFRESGWDLKHMVRLIVHSATWQQSSHPTASSLAADPSNQWLSRQNPRRLEAEIVRDNALSIGGLLNPEIGGPPAFPWQPGGYYAQLQFPDRDYHPSADSQQYRRGVYMHWQRTFLHPMLANFDAPSREECTGLRIEANTPQQALTLLNDPTFVEAARGLALRSHSAGSSQSTLSDSDADTVRWMLRETLFRQATADETESLKAFLAGQREHFRKQTADAEKLLSVGLPFGNTTLDPVELAARTSLARVLLNLHETITRY